MISIQEFDHLCAGHFAALTLESGITLHGYAGRDLADVKFIRVDGLVTEDDGTVGQFSVRLERSQIQQASILTEAPVATASDGTVHRMRSAFWKNIE